MSQCEIEWGVGEKMAVRSYSCEFTMLPSFVKDGESFDGLHPHPKHVSVNQGGDGTFRKDGCCSNCSSQQKHLASTF